MFQLTLSFFYLHRPIGAGGSLYYDPLSAAGMARSRADSVNAYMGAPNPFSDWSWGADFHELGQFGIGEGKGQAAE